jgi:hypothetical protein
MGSTRIEVSDRGTLGAPLAIIAGRASIARFGPQKKEGIHHEVVDMMRRAIRMLAEWARARWYEIRHHDPEVAWADPVYVHETVEETAYFDAAFRAAERREAAGKWAGSA